LRCDQTGSLGAVGLQFEIPVGDRKVFQDTGSLSLRPYVTLEQRLFKTPWGRFNAMGTFGYSFAVDNERTDFFFNSYQLDFDVGCLHKIYPLVELNWFHYTTNGGAQPFPLGFEGKDLFNFGSPGIAGHNELSIAVGARFKPLEAVQFGVAAEF